MLVNKSILKLEGIKLLHFIGIGGISMSGLAEILLNIGFTITGSDLKESSITRKLEAMGIRVYIGHSESNINNADLVVYTAAIRKDNPEMLKAIESGIPTMERAVLLGQIMAKYPYSIAVSGTHGKTTTTSIITTIMLESNMNPTVHIGGELTSIGGTTKIGEDKFFIAEACEYHSSFLYLHPYLAVILNIDFDHADYFKDINHVIDTFTKFAQRVPDNGYIVACIDDPNVQSVLDKVNCNIITYGLNSKDAMWSAKNIQYDPLGHPSFELLKNNKVVASIKMSIPGLHNVKNALAAIAACNLLGCDLNNIKNSIKNFMGTQRRFELKGSINNIRVIDDYAHHPSEVRATLKAIKNGLHGKIWCVFQPHTYSRTKSLLSEFSTSFNDADNIILTDIYAAREIDNGEIHSRTIAERIQTYGKNAIYIPDLKKIVQHLQDNVSPGDIIITMGAGDIYKVGEMFLNSSKIMAVG
ncbi:MAG: UDP-N-acetylmuramate--L-alanine ligase [Clostridiales bacterium]|nr:UDP-N-acetylmuramate--L-alanine ligase [Clostridiales bacterium]